YYAPILGPVSSRGLIVQSRNRGTAPAILYSLLRIVAVDPDAVVAVFPSDHYVSEDQAFMTQVRSALETACFRPRTVILLGVEADTPEVEYGWIEPARPMHKFRRIFNVRRFWEKPNKLQAQVLQLRGCLWNSFVMVASARALLDLIETALPGLYRILSWLGPVAGKPEEEALSGHLYNWIEPTNFSHEVLARCPERLAVLKVTGVRWNDLGEPSRVLASLKSLERAPEWADAVVPTPL
ncbi:MAG TPA: sugar phosphate nucleotidyltransferase, partial [Terriglobales bacterium]|nr:sugar phosphate nucleotidyltransferase [Terriglobales bacterium]